MIKRIPGFRAPYKRESSWDYGLAEVLSRMKKESPVKFKPGFFVNMAGSQIEIRWKAVPEHSKWLNKDVSIHMDRDTDEVVGCTIPIPQELTLRVDPKCQCCLRPDTLVQTSGGPKMVSEITELDRLIGEDGKSHLQHGKCFSPLSEPPPQPSVEGEPSYVYFDGPLDEDDKPHHVQYGRRFPPPPEPPPPPPPRMIKEGQVPTKEEYGIDVFSIPPPRKSQVIEPEYVNWRITNRCFYTGIESGGDNFPVKGMQGTIFKTGGRTNKLPIQVIWDDYTVSNCLPVSIGKPKRKSFWDWFWNFCIRARTSRKREGCSWKYYKSATIFGRE